MSSKELPLFIPVQKLNDFLSCPICLCRMTETHMTTCGHRFCKDCIKESVSHHHKCPCCNKPLETSDVLKDHQFDILLEMIGQETINSTQQYFDNLLKTTTPSTSEDSEENKNQQLSVVEKVLTKHLKKSLIAHENYFQSLKRSYNKKLEQLEKTIVGQKSELLSEGMINEGLEDRLNELDDQLQTQKTALKEELNSCLVIVADAYDSYLEKHVPDLSVLPVTVSVNILDKNIQIPDVRLKPDDSMEYLKSLIEENMERRGDRIIKYEPNVRFICFGPFTKRSQYETSRLAYDVVEHGATNNDVFLLPDGCRPVLQYSLKPGSEIVLYGNIMLRSEQPVYCFSKMYNPEEHQTVDYFTCKTCSFNWICRSCMEKCHQKHNVAPYIMKHKPTWACCYCPKKKKVPTATLR